ncbi:MAG TPA: Xaa-Pro peptidase family protein [Thermohalobaculum sp.]|nr:Xaa-Pro peptidase family protein [Thermohalobaculum sp.]
MPLSDLAALPRGFPDAEFEARLARAQQLMRDTGLAALLLTTEPEVRWFSGFLTQFWQSPTRPWFLVVPAQGKPVAVIPAIGAECMGRTWIEDIRTWSSPDPEDDGVSLLTATLREVAGGGPVGLPMGPETHLRMPLSDFERVKSALAGIVFADATPLMRRLRVLKSEAEVAKIRFAAQAASKAFARVPEILSIGMSESACFRTFKIAALEAGLDDVAYLVGGAGPGGYGDIISPPSERALAPGDVLILDIGGVHDGYYCDFDRNFGVGSISDDARRAHDLVWRATEAGLAAARPGATFADLFHAMQGAMSGGGVNDAAGDANVGRLGHGLGMQLTEFPSITPWDQTVLEPGMVLTLEPGMAFAPGRMMVHEENIVISEDGAELLTVRAPREMPIIG